MPFVHVPGAHSPCSASVLGSFDAWRSRLHIVLRVEMVPGRVRPTGTPWMIASCPDLKSGAKLENPDADRISHPGQSVLHRKHPGRHPFQGGGD